MKYLLLLLLILEPNNQALSDQQIFYNEDFKWTIAIPENFYSVSPSEWKKIQNMGSDAIENTIGDKVIDQSKTIFVFKNAQFNYLESNYQPFDIEIDGDYLESVKNVNEIIKQTLKTQLPNAQIETASSVKMISGLEFQTHTIILNFSNGMTMHMLMYSRLFNKKEFTVNIMYVDKELGKNMIDAWSQSKFE